MIERYAAWGKCFSDYLIFFNNHEKKKRVCMPDWLKRLLVLFLNSVSWSNRYESRVLTIRQLRLKKPLRIQAYHFPILSEMIRSDVFHIVSEAFVEPQVIPPLHSDQVTKPLVRKLVRHHYGYILFVSGTGRGRVTQQVSFAESEYSPVFHRSSREIRHSNQVCGVKKIMNRKTFSLKVWRKKIPNI